ncbi:hypothetical protein F2P81_013650 [Scophthalmus maximus]|uniref:Uncharacterized protein n=1 Tax=Scophthalmus maximus TaxID=52904 RepID=A0A6A4SRB9_SCOMX|nr:hypothetical protein F2P81_013650 [Scophthalmus maximus]
MQIQRGLMKRLEEEIKFNSFMVPEKLPEELQGGRHTVQYLQEVASEPAMGQAGLQELEDKLKHEIAEQGNLYKKKKRREVAELKAECGVFNGLRRFSSRDLRQQLKLPEKQKIVRESHSANMEQMKM